MAGEGTGVDTSSRGTSLRGMQPRGTETTTNGIKQPKDSQEQMKDSEIPAMSPSSQLNTSKPSAYLVDEAIATLEEAEQQAKTNTADFTQVLNNVFKVLDWLKSIVTYSNIHKQFKLKGLAQIQDPQLSLPIADVMAHKPLEHILALYLRLIVQKGMGRRLPSFKPAIMAMRVARVQLLVLNQEYVSFELAESMGLPMVSTKLTNLTTAELHVLAWLRRYREDIIYAGDKYGVDRRGIGGAIAWEALENLRTLSHRSVGVGKIHIWEFWKQPVIEEAEIMGYLERTTKERRREILKTPTGSIIGVAAIMKALADIARGYGFKICCDPGMLATVYNGFGLKEWQEHLKKKVQEAKAKKQPLFLEVNPGMGKWVNTHLKYIEEGVGESWCSVPGDYPQVSGKQKLG